MVCVSGPNTGLALPLSDPTDVCFSQLCKSTTVQLLPLKAEVTSFSGTSAGCCYRPPPAFSLCSLLFTGCVCLCQPGGSSVDVDKSQVFISLSAACCCYSVANRTVVSKQLKSIMRLECWPSAALRETIGAFSKRINQMIY